MRIFNVAKIGVLLLCILLVLPMMTGCANELREQKNDDEIKQEQLEQIEQEWESVIQYENSDIAKIEIVSHVFQSPYSSTIQPSHVVTLVDKKQIDTVINALSNPDVSWKHAPNDSEELGSFYESHYGQQEIEVRFWNSNDQVLLKLNIYEDNTSFICSQPEVISENHVKWHGKYWMIFPEDMFQSLYELQKSFE